MKHFLTRFFAVLLSICVAASVLTVSAAALPAGGGNISPHPSATVPVPSGGGMVAGFVANWLANIGGQALSSWYDERNDENIMRNIQVMSDNDSISVSYNKDEGKYYFSANPELTGESLECATYLANELETNVNRYIFAHTPTILDNPDSFSISPEFYSFCKKVSYNSLNSYYIQNSDRFKAEHSGNSIQSVRDLENALGNTFPRYDFDFVGPIPTLSMTTPNVDRISSLTMDGFTFTPAASFTPGQTAFTRSQTEYIASFVSGYVHSAGDYIRLNPDHDPLYAFNYYFLTDDGNLYFSTYLGYGSNGITGGNSYPLNTSSFYDISGKMITGKEANAIKSRITSVGAVLNTGNQIQNAVPVGVKGTLTDEDFVTSTGGEELINGIPRSFIENVIGGAIGAGLIAADAPLTIGADGSIIAADGIPVDKLGEILEALQSGNLNLDSIADYLSLISTLVGNGNLTMTEQQKILENVNANTKAGAKDLAQIRAAIEELTDALTKEYEWEAEDENADGEISWITAEHTGLKEAKDFVDKIEFVNQSTKLLGNLFGKYERLDSQAPKFSFYWDSDKDGVTEKYTVLDLSFMEQRLTNANIDDKRRFQSSMTIRGFVRYLIVFLSYVGFVIKILKRLPSMIGGAGESADNIDTSFFSKKG